MSGERKPRPTTQLLEAARRNRYKVIHERSLLILALAKHAGFECHLVPAAGEPKEGAWKKVLCLHTPAGQLHWHLSEADVLDFKGHIPNLRKDDHYDGCKAPEKAERLALLHTLDRGGIVVSGAAVTIQTADAVDPHAASTGTPSTRV